MARFSERSLTCAGVQQTLLVDQTSPHRETSSDRNTSEGYTSLMSLYVVYLLCFSIIGTRELFPEYVQRSTLHSQRLATRGRGTCPRIAHRPSLFSSVAEVIVKDEASMSVVRYSGHRGLRMIIAVLDVRVDCGLRRSKCFCPVSSPTPHDADHSWSDSS
jgi:hypothetical protein